MNKTVVSYPSYAGGTGLCCQENTYIWAQVIRSVLGGEERFRGKNGGAGGGRVSEDGLEGTKYSIYCTHLMLV